jgi:hypothetical protein
MRTMRTVASLRALPALGCVFPLALAACAPPLPARGECIEIYSLPCEQRRHPWHYAINGRVSSRDQLEHIVAEAPAHRAVLRRCEAWNMAGMSLILPGMASMGGGLVGGLANRNALFALIGVPGVAAVVTSIVLTVSCEDLFFGFVTDYNNEARKRGYCGDPPTKEPSSASPAATW